MLVAIVGGNGTARKAKAKEMLSKLFPKTSFQFALFESLPDEGELLALSYQSQGFFNDKQIVLIKDIGEELLDVYKKDTLEALAISDTTFFLLDESLTKAARAKVEKYDSTVVELPKEEKKSSFDKNSVFAICDAFSAKNRFSVWHEFSKLAEKDESPEAIIGILFSRVRAMLRDKRYGSYKKDELESLSSSLALLLPRERARGNDTLLSLERWILALPE